MTSYLFLADGFEEIEALATVDILRRAGIDVKTVSIKETREVKGAHGVTVSADLVYDEMAYAPAEWLILPGGMPGASNLAAHERLCDKLHDHNAKGGKIAAICASPGVVLGPLGIMRGKAGVCYPGFETLMQGCNVQSTLVAVDDNVVTGSSPAAAMPFALAIVEIAKGAEVADSVAQGMLLREDSKKSEYYFG